MVSRTTLRIVIILAGLSIAGITITQVYWVRKAFDIRENQFNRDVNSALGNVAQKLFEINHTPSPANNPVTQVSTNYFVVLVNGPVHASLLEWLLTSEFEKRNITTEFEYGIYDCVDKCMVGGGTMSPTKVKSATSTFPETPRLSSDGYYFAVQFPSLQANLISQMGIWGFSSAVMLIVIFFFVYTMFVILRQRRLSEIQRDFINNMTHEFKTPISTISISSEVLKDPAITRSPERLLNYATIIGNESQRLQQQVERVLQMAEVEKESPGIRLEMVDLHEIIRKAVKSCEAALVSRGGEISLSLEATPSLARVDAVHFTNVIYNLIDNAIKYNIRTPHISVITTHKDGSVQIAIKDNGIGMTPDDQKKVFHKFYRVPTGNVHDNKGFGLGLYYVRLIMESLGGDVKLESKPGSGSTFTLTIPLS